MLLNSWLSFARRNLLATGVRRVNRTRTQHSARLEPLEERKMLAVNALVINQDNYDRFTNLAGGLVVNNASMAGYDGLVIQGVSLTPSTGDAITINLSGIRLQRLALDSVVVESGNRPGINIDLTDVTGLQSVAFDNVDATKAGRGLDLLLSNTDTQSLVVEGSRIAGILVTATAGADIQNGLITNNLIDAPAGIEGVLLDVQSQNGVVSTADGFRIENNPRITTRDRDAIRVTAGSFVDPSTRSTVTALSGLSITGNSVSAGSAAGADVNFRAEGDTFVQPFNLTNTSVRGDLLQSFVFDLRDIGLVFDPDPVTGKPFTAVNGTGGLTGVTSSVLSNNNQTLTVTFSDFNPGETLQFLLDIDLVGNIPASIFGNQLIGADVTFNYTQNKQITGQMAGDPDRQSGSQFLPGSVLAGLAHGINLDASAVPLRNLQVTGNTVTGSQGYGLYLNSRTYSDVTGTIEDNQISGSGRDGIRVSMSDSRFAGGIFDNNIANNGGVGINLLPVTTASGRIISVTGGRVGAPFIITSNNHGLQTGQEVILQGIQDGVFGLNHNANGRFLVTRLSNNTFSLQGTGIDWGRANIYAGGGSWYLPDFRGGSLSPDAARGFTQIDLKVDGVSQPITGASNAADIEIISVAHGLKTGDQIRITGVQGNSAANGTYRVTVISADRFLLKGRAGNGDYTVGGSFVKLAEAAVNGDVVRQGLLGNLITGNLLGGIRSVSEVGTTVRADVALNTIAQNEGIGVQFQSYSFGLGTALPLPSNAPTTTVQNQDLGFSVNVGTESPGQGNVSGNGNSLLGNRGSAIAIEALDFGTGSFEIWNNTIAATRTPLTTGIPFAGDGISVRLDNDRIQADAPALLQKSVIRNNVIGVDNLGNAGNGLFFQMAERTRIQDLDVINNTFLNSGRDGFHFERSEDARLNSVKFEKNKSTNNAGDGFDLFAQNTTLDRLDFNINDNFIEDNGQYGLRVDAQADARLDIQFDSNSVKRNGRAPGGTGFHPADGVAGSAGAAGGVGIRAFQQIDVIFNATDTAINDNIGDGLSLDAFNFFDTLIFTSSFTRVTMDGNSLTGLRNHGAAFGGFTIVDSSFSNNGEDGFRSVSIEDKSDPYLRRVGGMDLDLYSLKTAYNGNGKDGVKLGQGISAAFGDGVVANGNTFDLNGRNGLMITQHNSPYLDNLYAQGNERRRIVQVNHASMSGNGRNGVDIGMDAQQEGGNLQQADEVAADVYVVINNADILNNAGDGLEFLGDDTFEVGRITGGGQDIFASYNSALQILNSRLASNDGRGIDILNRQQSDVYVTIRNNDILANGLEGIYVVNTASIDQLQGTSADPLTVFIDTGDSNIPSPNIELRVQDNLIQSNGDRNRNSRVPTRFEFGNNDASGVANLDWGPATTFVAGTLGGLVVRVGTAQSSGIIRVANPGLELGRSGIDAEVWNNLFDGNVGADVYFDNFISHMPRQSQGLFDASHTPRFSWDQGFRDPLSRFDLSFRGNIGNSIDLMNGFAFLDNKEDYFKSRSNADSTSPPSNHAHGDLNPNGHFNGILPTDRRRNATRTIGFLTDVVGDIPSSVPMIADDGSSVLPGWSYDGLGTPTWRVESDFELSGFKQMDPTVGFSSFYTVVTMDGLFDYQWDTGVNTPNFIGATPYSLNRGDIFNVKAGEDPIAPDSLENNNNFVGASRLGTISGSFLVNSLAIGNNLNIHTKTDRDYYRFTAAATGTATVNLNLTDALGDDVQFMVYVIDPSEKTEEVAVSRDVDGTTQYVAVSAGSNGALGFNVESGREYVIEILSDETENVGTTLNGKPFRFGTTRSYDLSIDAPAASGGGGGGGGGGGDGGAGGGSQNTGGSKPGAPDLQAIGPVSPDPRNTAVGAVTITFSEDVTGVDIGDFRLTRNGVDIPLTGLSVNALSAFQYSIDLGALTGEPGAYALTLVSAGSDIRDLDTNRLILKDGSGNSVPTKSDTWDVVVAATSLADLPDTNPGDGLAQAITGAFSLRAAVMESNASPGSDVVYLPAGVYQLSIGGIGEDGAATGDLDVTGNLTIRGAGAGQTFIDGGLLDRVFHVLPGASLTLEGVTVRRGFAADGGGIYNSGTLTLKGVNVINSVAGNQGGGIFNAGTLTATSSSVSENVAGSRGGGINNTRAVTLISTTLAGNYAVSRGGGLYLEAGSSQLKADLFNVTIAGNESGSRGGGVFNDSAAALVLSNSILERNTTDADIPASSASTSLDLAGGMRSAGFNRIQVLDASFSSAASAGLLTTDTFGRDAAPLDAVTQSLTYAVGSGVGINPLIVGGAAVDAGSNALYPVTPTAPLVSQLDGVDNPRLIDGNRDGVFVIDQGAAEYLTNIPVALFTASPNPAALGETVTFDATRSSHPNPSSGRRIVKLDWFFDYTPGAVTPDLTTTGAVRTATKAYNTAGRNSYIVRLVVTDDAGNSDFMEQQVLVGIPTPPVVTRPFTVTTDTTPEFRWTASPARYTVTLRQTGTADRILASNLTTTTFTPTTPLAPGAYSVLITATNNMGSATSAPRPFTITTLGLNEPQSGVSIFDVTPIFRWGDIPGTSRYELKVNRLLPIPKADVISESFIDRNSYEAKTSLGLGTFEWQVRAYDADGTAGEWSSLSRFTTATPVLAAPLSPTMDDTPTFSWNNMNAARYELWVNQVNGPVKIIYQGALTTTSFTPVTRLPNGTFDAWVRALAADGEAGLWSPRLRFQMDYRLGPETYSPTGNTTDTTPTFSWQAIDGAKEYDLWVDNRSTGVTQVIRVKVPHVVGATKITWTPSTALGTSNYRWWVKAIGPDGRSTAWSIPKDFLVPVPAIVKPRGNIGTNLPLFTWTGVPEYVSYDLWVDNLTTGAKQVLRVTDAKPYSFQTVLPFENGTFRAWIRGFDKDNNVSQWSSPSDFTISVGIGVAPTLVSPTRFAGVRPNFFWQGGSNVVTYEILVKDMTQTSQPTVINARFINGTTFTSPVTLIQGRSYRWWVRGLDVDGNGLPWSQPMTFTVVSSEQPNVAPAGVPTLDGALVPAVFDLQQGVWNGDGVRSFVTAPTGVVAQVDLPLFEELQTTVTEAVVTQPAAVAEPAIDDVMAAWSEVELAEVIPMPAAIPVAAPVTSEKPKQAGLPGTALAMLAGLVVGRRSRRRDGQES